VALFVGANPRNNRRVSKTFSPQNEITFCTANIAKLITAFHGVHYPAST